MNKEKGMIEKGKSFLWQNTTAVGETYLGLLVAVGSFPVFLPTLAGVIFISRGTGRFRKAWGV